MRMTRRRRSPVPSVSFPQLPERQLYVLTNRQTWNLPNLVRQRSIDETLETGLDSAGPMPGGLRCRHGQTRDDGDAVGLRDVFPCNYYKNGSSRIPRRFASSSLQLAFLDVLHCLVKRSLTVGAMMAG